MGSSEEEDLTAAGVPRDDGPSPAGDAGSGGPVVFGGTDGPTAILRAALEEAYAHKSALFGLYEQLRAEGHAYASHAAYEASEAAYQLVVQLAKDVEEEEKARG